MNNPGQFEAGENVTDQVRRNGPTGIVVSVRLMQEDSDKLIALAEQSGKTVSQVAREAIHAFASQRRQHPAFAPEITGSTPWLSIVAFTPLGPRTEGVHVEIDEG